MLRFAAWNAFHERQRSIRLPEANLPQSSSSLPRARERIVAVMGALFGRAAATTWPVSGCLPPTNDDLPDVMTRLRIPFAFLLLCTPVAQAAPQFDWLLARHRSLSAEQLTPPAVLQAAPALDGGAAWIGSSRSLPMPMLVEGGVGSGVRVGRTLVDRPGGLRLRLGATLAASRRPTSRAISWEASMSAMRARSAPGV